MSVCSGQISRWSRICQYFWPLMTFSVSTGQKYKMAAKIETFLTVTPLTGLFWLVIPHFLCFKGCWFEIWWENSTKVNLKSIIWKKMQILSHFCIFSSCFLNIFSNIDFILDVQPDSDLAVYLIETLNGSRVSFSIFNLSPSKIPRICKMIGARVGWGDFISSSAMSFIELLQNVTVIWHDWSLSVFPPLNSSFSILKMCLKSGRYEVSLRPSNLLYPASYSCPIQLW